MLDLLGPCDVTTVIVLGPVWERKGIQNHPQRKRPLGQAHRKAVSLGEIQLKEGIQHEALAIQTKVDP